MMSDDEALYVRAQHIHIVSCNGDDDNNYGNEVGKADDKASYIKAQDGNDVNNYGNEVNIVNDKSSYIMWPDG